MAARRLACPVLTVGAAQLGPDPARRQPRRRGQAHDRAAAPGRRARLRARRLPRAGADDLLPALVDDRPGGDRQLLRARDAVATRPRRCSTRRSGSASASIWALPSSSGAARGRAASTPRSWSTARARSSATTARSICPATPSTSPGAPSSTWRSATSRSATWASACGARMDANIGMCICNDRRWPETYRVMGLQDVEMVAARLQHAAPQPAGARPRPPERVPQPAVHAGRRLRQRHLGGRRRQVRRRGGLRADRRLVHHRADRPDRGAGADARTTSWWWRAATSTWA